jgi:hypothetical protein
MRGGVIAVVWLLPAMLAADVVDAAFASNMPRPMTCLRALVALAGGQVPDDSDFATTECPFEHIPVSFHFDTTHRINRAIRNIRAGDVVHRYAGYGDNVIHVGQKLLLVSSAGTVRIERGVIALQPARRGQRLFVSTEEGQVLSVTYQGEEP